MNTISIPHPSSFIDIHSIHFIRQFTAESEKLGSLHPELLSIIYKEHWFNLFVPKEYGGLGLSLGKIKRKYKNPHGLRIIF